MTLLTWTKKLQSDSSSSENRREMTPKHLTNFLNTHRFTSLISSLRLKCVLTDCLFSPIRVQPYVYKSLMNVYRNLLYSYLHVSRKQRKRYTCELKREILSRNAFRKDNLLLIRSPIWDVCPNQVLPFDDVVYFYSVRARNTPFPCHPFVQKEANFLPSDILDLMPPLPPPLLLRFSSELFI